MLDNALTMSSITAWPFTEPEPTRTYTYTHPRPSPSLYDDEHMRHLARSTGIGLLLSAFIAFAVAGNTLVIVAIVTDRHLRRTSNYFLVSLAVADTLMALVVMTFALVNEVLGLWPFGPIFCNVWLSADVMCSTASILHLSAVSLDRYIHVRMPFHYDRLVTSRRSLAAIALIWILSALLSVLPIHLGWHRLDLASEKLLRVPSTESISSLSIATAVDDYLITAKYGIVSGAVDDVISVDFTDVMNSPNSSHSVAVEEADKCELVLNPLYAVISSLVSFYIPCVLMIAIYWKLYCYAMMHVRSINKTMRSGFAARSGSVHVAGSVYQVDAAVQNGTPRLGEFDRHRPNSTEGEKMRRTSDICPPYGRNANRNYLSTGSVNVLCVANEADAEKRVHQSLADLQIAATDGSSSTSTINKTISCGRLHTHHRRSSDTSSTRAIAGYRKRPSADVSNPNRRGSSGAAGRDRAYKQSEYKAAVTLGIIMGVFLVCWTPFFTINIVAAFYDAWQNSMTFVVFTWLGYMNSTMNPVIYGVFNQEFRRAFKRVLSVRRCVLNGCCFARHGVICCTCRFRRVNGAVRANDASLSLTSNGHKRTLSSKVGYRSVYANSQTIENDNAI